jgi:hypothetical protein
MHRQTKEFFVIGRLVITFLFVFPFCVAAQEGEPVTDIFKVGVLDPGISFEKATGKKQSLFFNAHLSPYFSFLYSSNLGTSTDFRMEPSLTLHYRFYYNGKARARKEKFTERNSMNYLTPVYSVVFSKRRLSTEHYEETSLRPIHSVVFSWGLQRNYNNRFSLDFNFGPGVIFTRSSMPDGLGNTKKSGYSSFTILAGANIGFWLNRRPPSPQINQR